MGMLDDPKINLREPGACPYDKEPCITERCNAWVTYQRADGKTFVGCSVIFTPVLLGEIVVELQRNQASADKVATEVNQGFAGLTHLALVAGKRKALRGA